MGIGLGVILAVIGVILLLNVVELPAAIDDVVATNTLGWILLIAGIVVIVLALIQTRSANRSVVEERRR
ncbi:DUF6458 family protein [Nocardioides rotundus]|uniref:DUF6458 family protein n=1 Tax=Nocardioides rotundus TaxID=1774216 RepID=UPI001CBB5776|nr:DUF6458 family protein [Nocardioides rotundus]UAL30229.1 DUF6458 family protein [Nocardioides rotundus]